MQKPHKAKIQLAKSEMAYILEQEEVIRVIENDKNALEKI